MTEYVSELMTQADVSTVQVKVPAEYAQLLAVNVCPAMTIWVILSWLTVSVELSRSTKVTLTLVFQLQGVPSGGVMEILSRCSLMSMIVLLLPSL